MEQGKDVKEKKEVVILRKGRCVDEENREAGGGGRTGAKERIENSLSRYIRSTAFPLYTSPFFPIFFSYLFIFFPCEYESVEERSRLFFSAK